MGKKFNSTSLPEQFGEKLRLFAKQGSFGEVKYAFKKVRDCWSRV